MEPGDADADAAGAGERVGWFGLLDVMLDMGDCLSRTRELW